ncbi:hypothetical protein PT974_03652 [Cladobotryum mycophilum]|uniref:Zn(2)-C6 fungal-type domain-containing protein n=1 Tax=Cladobotryum mycophilum TaxID=491253 RepID=A0ABR0ST18_9HYPO
MKSFGEQTMYRHIQPAQSSNSTSASFNSSSLPKKRAVLRACYDCRRAKIKCDGQRPKCGPCEVKDRKCGYDDDEAPARRQQQQKQQKPASSTSRLEALETLVDALQTSSSDQAENLLQRIRSSDNPVTMLDNIAKSPIPLPSATSEVQDSKGHLEGWLQSQNVSDYSSLVSGGISDGSSVYPETHSSFNMTSISAAGAGAVTATQGLSGPDEALKMRAPPFMENAALNVIQHCIPSASDTQEAVNVFFSCSGRLLHVFSKEQAEARYSAVFNDQNESTEGSKADLCCVMGLASVGAQYMCGVLEKETEEAFYGIAKHYLDMVIEERPYDAIKVCALLAMYNIMGKATVSLAYVEIGLGMCRRFGINTHAGQMYATSEEEWVDNRKTWRTLMFLSSWLSTTLGYISGNDVLSDRINLSELQVDDPRNISDVVQTEIAKICLLKANILRLHLAVNEITAPALQSVIQDLQTWYAELPEQMRLEGTGRDDLTVETKRSIHHVHLHYLGAMMLLYSRIASQYMQPGKDWSLMPTLLRALLEQLAGEAVIAASTSSRILQLLYDEDSIFKRCWLVIFQAYTSCLVILHSIIQRQLHGFDNSTLQQDLEHAQVCLTILDYCGALDKVAASFHKQLTAVFERILVKEEYHNINLDDIEMGGTHSGDHAAFAMGKDGQEYRYLLTVPEHPDMSHLTLSLSLLGMLCRPFGHPSSMIIGPAQANESLDEEVVPQTRSWSKWGSGNGTPFDWDLNLLLSDKKAQTDIGDAGDPKQLNSCGRFLGSSEPSGWVPSTFITQTIR